MSNQYRKYEAGTYLRSTYDGGLYEVVVGDNPNNFMALKNIRTGDSIVTDSEFLRPLWFGKGDEFVAWWAPLGKVRSPQVGKITNLFWAEQNKCYVVELTFDKGTQIYSLDKLSKLEINYLI